MVLLQFENLGPYFPDHFDSCKDKKYVRVSKKIQKSLLRPGHTGGGGGGGGGHALPYYHIHYAN